EALHAGVCGPEVVRCRALPTGQARGASEVDHGEILPIFPSLRPELAPSPRAGGRLPGLHRAGPSAPLDEVTGIVPRWTGPEDPWGASDRARAHVAGRPHV